MFGIFGRKKKLPWVAFTIEVDTSSATWQTSVSKVLTRSRGVSRFGIEESGYVAVVGTVDPEKIVKKLAKAGTRAISVYVFLYDYIYGTAGRHIYGYEYPLSGGIAWPCCNCNGYHDSYPVNGYPANHVSN